MLLPGYDIVTFTKRSNGGDSIAPACASTTVEHSSWRVAKCDVISQHTDGNTNPVTSTCVFQCSVDADIYVSLSSALADIEVCDVKYVGD